MFQQNKYTTWYFSIIHRAQERDLQGYYEIHHIIPKSLGGCNDQSNLVKLTPREHFVCHRLLCRMVLSTQKSKMFYALWRMANSGKYKFNSHTYQSIREKHSSFLSETKRGVKRKPFSEETRKRMSDAHIGIGKGRKHSEQTKTLMSQKRKGLTVGEKNPFYGKTHSPETREAIANSNKKRAGIPKPRIQCPCCGKEVTPNSLSRHQRSKMCVTQP